MDKYEQMSDNELREIMAHRLNWRITVYTDEYGNQALVLLDPDDRTRYRWGIHRDKSIEANIQKAWENPGTLPNWPQNAADALALWSDAKEITINIERRYLVILIEWTPNHEFVEDLDKFTSQAVARALTIAFLRWQDAQGK